MAAAGRLYNYAYSMPSCAPTRSTLLSGRYPFRNGIDSNGASNQISRSNCLLGSLFKAQGYSTYMLGKWQLSQIDKVVQRE
jgi:arylsulfatase A-like enzyme